MLVRTARVSSKGQLTLPADMLRALRLGKGADLVLVLRGEEILLIPADRVAKLVSDELAGFEALALPAFAQVWDNDADEAWNHV